MTFDDYQKLGSEERMRARIGDLALVGATQSGVGKLNSDETDASIQIAEARILIAHQRAVTSLITDSIEQAVLRVCKDTHFGEATVQKVIESYERTASKAAG